MIVPLLLVTVIFCELFKYKAEIPISVQTLSSLKLTYVRISVDTENLIINNFLENDCEDLIFRNFSNHTIPHWIEHGCNSPETIIWLLVDDTTTLPPRVMNLTMFSGNIFHEEDPEYEKSKLLDEVLFFSFSNQECSSHDYLSLEKELSERFIRISTSTSNEFGGEFYHQHQIQYHQRSTSQDSIAECSSGGTIEGTPNPHYHDFHNETNPLENDFPHYNIFLCPSPSLDFPSQPVISMNQSNPPSGWRILNSTFSRFIKVTNGTDNLGVSGPGFNHTHFIDTVSSNRSISIISSVLEGSDIHLSESDHYHMIGSTSSDVQNIAIPHIRLPFFEPDDEEGSSVVTPMYNIFVFYTSPTTNNMHESIPGVRFVEESSYDGKFLLGHDTFDLTYNLDTTPISTSHSHTVRKFVNSTDVIYASGVDSPVCEENSEVEAMEENHTHEFEIEMESTSHLPPYFSVFIGEKYEPDFLSEIDIHVHMNDLIDHSWSCYDIPFDSPDQVCSGRGMCVSQDNCECPEYVFGADCAESIGGGEYSSGFDRIIIHYKITIVSLERHVPHALESFKCSEIIENIDEVGEDSMCWFETTRSLMTTSELVIVDCNEGVETVLLYPITKHSEIVESSITKVSPPPTLEVYTYAVPTGIGLPCLICLCLVCCCSCVVCCCVAWRLALRLCKLRRYRSLSKAELGEMLLEKEMEEKEGNVAKLRIDSRLFEIAYEDIKVIETIGDGGSNSTVFKAKWKGQTVAFKCFKTSTICSDQSVFTEFEREVEILSSVSHPNVLDFYGATLRPPRVGIVMEFCKYGDLTVFFTTSGQLFPFIERLRILKEVAAAMSYLHSNNIIHRDLKAENVLLNKAFESKVMDFGLSRMLDEMNAEKTVRIGTSMYMAPEVVKGSKYDERCDIFSFGIMIHCVIVNDFHPYSGEEDGFNIEMRVANDPTFRPRLTKEQLEEEFSGNEWLVDCMKACWEDLPDNRPSFDEVNESLTEHKKDQIKKYERKKDSDEEEEVILMSQDELWNLQDKMKEMRESLEELHEMKMENENLKEKVNRLREQKRVEEEEKKRKRLEEQKRRKLLLRQQKKKKKKENLSNLGTGPISSSLRFQLKKKIMNEDVSGRNVKSVDYSKKGSEESDDENEGMSEDRRNYWKKILSSAKRKSAKRESLNSSSKKEINKSKRISNRRIMFAFDGENKKLSNWRERAKKADEEERSLIEPTQKKSSQPKIKKKKVRFQLTINNENDEEVEIKVSSDDDDSGSSEEKSSDDDKEEEEEEEDSDSSSSEDEQEDGSTEEKSSDDSDDSD